jgi:hypothetical protein
VSVVIGLFGNINHVLLHRYYRDRLLEAYMARPDLAGTDKNHVTAGHFYLRSKPVMTGRADHRLMYVQRYRDGCQPLVAVIRPGF